MRTRRFTIRSGVTLLELLAAVVVMSIIAVVLMPIVTTASESYTETRRVRNNTEHVAFALDRITRIMRQAPIGASDTGVGVSSATVTSLIFTDGTGFQLNGSTLEMTQASGPAAPLCTDVDALSIAYLGDDGVTNMITTPELTHRFVVTLTSGQVTMSVLVHPRIWVGQEGS